MSGLMSDLMLLKKVTFLPELLMTGRQIIFMSPLQNGEYMAKAGCGAIMALSQRNRMMLKFESLYDGFHENYSKEITKMNVKIACSKATNEWMKGNLRSARSLVNPWVHKGYGFVCIILSCFMQKVSRAGV